MSIRTRKAQERKTVRVLVRLTPQQHEQVAEKLKSTGKRRGVATILRTEALNAMQVAL
jgi:hypothetical protein